MTKEELVKKVSEKSGFTQKDVKATMDCIFDVITDDVASGGTVKLNEIGVFVRNETKAREGRNPQTGEAVKIKAGFRLTFRASASFKGKLPKRK